MRFPLHKRIQKRRHAVPRCPVSERLKTPVMVSEAEPGGCGTETDAAGLSVRGSSPQSLTQIQKAMLNLEEILIDPTCEVTFTEFDFNIAVISGNIKIQSGSVEGEILSEMLFWGRLQLVKHEPEIYRLLSQLANELMWKEFRQSRINNYNPNTEKR